MVLGTAVRCRGENTVCSLFPAVSAHTGTRIYAKPGYWGTCQCCQNSHQLLAAHCTVNRGTLCQTKEAGKECPAQPSRQSKQRCRNKNAMTKSWQSFMHQGLVQPEDTAGIPLPSLCLGDRLSSNYGLLWKFHSPSSTSWLLHSWLFGKGSIKLAPKIVALESCHIARYLSLFTG